MQTEKLEQNEKRVISLYFSFFFNKKKCVCACMRSARAHNAIQLEHKQYECSAQHTVRLSHHIIYTQIETHVYERTYILNLCGSIDAIEIE